MKFLAALLTLAVAASAQTSTTTTSTSTATTTTSAPAATSSADACTSACKGDLACVAKCVGVPNPDSADISKTQDCINGCNSTTGQAKDNCITSCIQNNYMGSSQTSVNASGTAGSNGKSSASTLMTFAPVVLALSTLLATVYSF